MNYASQTKSNLIDILGYRDNEIKEFQSLFADDEGRLSELKEQQRILFWLLFITAGVGFMF